MERLADRVILLWGWRRALLAFAAGAVLALSQAPFDFFAAGLVSFTLLVWLLDGATPEPGQGWLRGNLPAFWTGWWFGFGYFLAGLYWVGNALLVEAEDFAWALPFAVLAFPALLAVFYGLATAAARLAWVEGIGRLAALAVAFGATEWLRATILTGFPWNAIGYAAMPVPLLMQSVVVTGLFGMSALAVFVFAMPALAAGRRHRWGGLLIALVLVGLHVAYGGWRLGQAQAEAESELEIRIVQPSVDQSEKWDSRARDRIFASLLELSALPPREGASPPRMILWPETSFPFLLTDRPDALVALSELLEDGQSLVAGAVRVEGTAADGGVRYYNSILSINDRGEIVEGYDKVHLVPFGEYLPFGDFLSDLGLRQVVRSFPGFSPGTQRRPMEAAEGARFLPFICYEIIFPGNGTQSGDADFAVNVTNDAWFGNTPGPYQHFRQAQLRAVELGLPLLRAANNGISGVIDPYGRVLDAFGLDAVGALDAALPLRRAERLPAGIAVWGQPTVFALLLLLVLTVRFAARRRPIDS
jgi:apolipoprotein N-acyltransferase